MIGIIALVININPSSRIDLLWMLPVCIGILYIVFYLPDNIEFDNDHLFIIRRRKEIVVDLKDIYLIKVTMISIGYRSLWKIRYTNNNEDGAARFYSRYFSSSFDNFCNQVKAKNPHVEIKNYSWSFDFDL